MRVKILKDYLGPKGRLHKAGNEEAIVPTSRLGQSLIKYKFVEPVFSQTEYWQKKGIRSKLTNLIIAPEDYTEGDKKHFTFDEALEIENKLGNGWRLPTRSEWVLICEEFGQKDGLLDSDTLAARLYLKLNGYKTACNHIPNAGTNGAYWSRTSGSSNYAYYLYFSSGDFNPGTNVNFNRYYGYSVRCVKEIKK